MSKNNNDTEFGCYKNNHSKLQDKRTPNPCNVIDFNNKVEMPPKDNFEDSTTQTIDWHNIANDCITFENFGLDTLKKFLDFYLSHYNNFYSNEFKGITDLSMGRIVSFDSYKLHSKTITDNNQTLYYVYALINKKKNFYRIGITGQQPLERLKNYIYVSTTTNPSLSTLIKYNNCLLDMRKLKGNRNNIPTVFEFRVLYVVDDKIYALLLEKFLTVFVNRFPSNVGFDLAVNNYYNPIVANLGYYSIKLDPNWIALSPMDIIPLIKKYRFSDDILNHLKFKNSHTLNKKLRLFNIGINSTGELLDARAYILKPFLEIAFKQDLDIDEFYKLCIKNGITFFEDFIQKSQYLDKICNYIWHDRINFYNLTVSKDFKL